MAHNPRVAICVPAYRQVEYLRRTLDSIAAQSFSDYEVVITDDSPDDAVEKLVGPYLSDARWSYARNPLQLGSPANWNEAVRKSKAPLVKVMHHDDRFATKNALAVFVRAMDKNPEAGFAFSATLVDDELTHRVRTHRPTPIQIADVSRAPATLFAGNVIGAPSATIYRRALGLTFDTGLKWLVDVDFYMRALRASSGLPFIKDPLVATTHNAAHQVTQTVQHDPVVDLNEHWSIFQRFGDAERDLPQIVNEWARILSKYRIGSWEQLVDMLPGATSSRPYFEGVLRRNGTFSRRAVGFVHRLHARLPNGLRSAASTALGAARRLR